MGGISLRVYILLQNPVEEAEWTRHCERDSVPGIASLAFLSPHTLRKQRGQSHPANANVSTVAWDCQSIHTAGEAPTWS